MNLNSDVKLILIDLIDEKIQSLNDQIKVNTKYGQYLQNINVMENHIIRYKKIRELINSVTFILPTH